MVNFNLIAPTAVEAVYTPLGLPQFEGNPMAEALPPLMSDEQLFDAMTKLPKFSSEQRLFPSEERCTQIKQLSDFVIPTKRHIKLARSLQSLLRAGYVGRIPRSLEHAEALLRLDGSRNSNRPNPSEALRPNPNLSALFMGLPGMGKSTSLKQFFSNIPQVIYHPRYNVYQITYLYIEMPSDGSSVKALAHAILNALDKLIPGARYFETYGLKKTSGEILMYQIARLLNQHFVGFIITDEIQNLLNARVGKSKEIVMTEVVSICNNIGTPILFVGTNKADQIFRPEPKISRRANGHGIVHWDRLSNSNSSLLDTTTDGRQEETEWDDFLNVLWTFQWVRNPVALDASFKETIYHLTQGTIDSTIKLFASAQLYAIANGSERLTVKLLNAIYEHELTEFHTTLDALRSNDISELMKHPDISPMGPKAIAEMSAQKVHARKSDAYSVKPTDDSFRTRIEASLVAGGEDEDRAIAAAEHVLTEGKAKNLADGVERARKFLKPRMSSTALQPKSTKTAVSPKYSPELAPGSYIHAINTASNEGTKVYSQLHKLGLTQPLGNILNLT